MPRNPAKNKHNDPKWWDTRLRKRGLAKNRGLNPRSVSYVGGPFHLVAIQEQKSSKKKSAQAPDNKRDKDYFDKNLIVLWRAPGFSAPSHETYLRYCAWCLALGIRPTSEIYYHDVATTPRPKKERP